MSLPEHRRICMNTLVRLPEVIKKTGLARTTIYVLIAEGKFPKPINLTRRSVAWLSSEIDSWIEEKVKLRCKRTNEVKGESHE